MGESDEIKENDRKQRACGFADSVAMYVDDRVLQPEREGAACL